MHIYGCISWASLFIFLSYPGVGSKGLHIRDMEWEARASGDQRRLSSKAGFKLTGIRIRGVVLFMIETTKYIMNRTSLRPGISKEET